ncbi:hypothetical protein P4C99_02955 [Pontiellaceae bacterium B1224]|nr:hypothetical protein [Pontiellaceae bacterium B1224]
MLRPELDWEGANLPLALSQNGTEDHVNQLRDPCLFRDADGQVYLFYSGKGEEAIGLALVHPKDSDSDGMSDDDENVAGTDPGNSNSVFHIETDAFSTFSWFSTTGRTYQIEYSTNLTDWLILQEDIAPTPPTNQQSVAAPTNAPQTFFRLQVDQ